MMPVRDNEMKMSRDGLDKIQAGGQHSPGGQAGFL